MNKVVIFGGSGFVGQALVKELLSHGFRVKIISRDIHKISFFKTYAGVDFIALQQWDYQCQDQLDTILKGSHSVINLVGILAQKKKGDFIKFHSEFPEILAQKCHELDVENFVHISALAIENAKNSQYAKSKLQGETSIRQHFPDATILRPSIIFGPRDNFFNKFAKMAKTLPALPLINDGKTKFQPIYVGDVAKLIVQSILHKKHQGQTYEIGGNKVYTFKTLLEFTGSYLGKDELRFSNLNFAQAKTLAGFLEIFTKNILTRDQVELLKTDNIVQDDRFKKAFSINLKAVEEIVPNYISNTKLQEYIH